MAGLSRGSVINVTGVEMLLCDSCKCGVVIAVSLMHRECLAILADFGSVYIPHNEGICVRCR